MSRRYVMFAIFSLLIGFIGFYYFHGNTTVSQLDVSEVIKKSLKLPVHKTKESTLPAVYRTDLHPLANPEMREAYLKRVPASWDDWAKSLTESIVGHSVQTGHISTSEEVESRYQKTYNYLKDQAARYEKKNHPLPETIIPMPDLSGPKYYQGTQTPKALIAEFDHKHSSGYDENFNVAMEEHYPRETFLQRVLDKGAVVKDTTDYDFYLDLRGHLLQKKEAPEEWISGKYGLPITTDFTEYEEGVLERKVWENRIIQEISAAYPYESPTIYFPSNHPDKYLPVVGKMTYVQIDEKNGKMRTSGMALTKEQRDNLLYKGIEPENIEVVFIDDDYNILSEKPKPFDPEKWLEENSYDIVPEGLRAPDGAIVSPERYQEITSQEMPYETRQKYDEYIGASPLAVDPAAEFARAEAEREAARTREVARAEFEHFQNEMRQTEKFQSIAAGEMSRALATQFLSKYAPKSGASKRMETALQTMFQHGFEEGLRRIRKDDSALAAELERQLAEAHRPPDPKLRRQNTIPFKPPEAPPHRIQNK